MNDNDAPDPALEREHDAAVRRARWNGVAIGGAVVVIGAAFVIGYVVLMIGGTR